MLGLSELEGSILLTILGYTGAPIIGAGFQLLSLLSIFIELLTNCPS